MSWHFIQVAGAVSAGLRDALCGPAHGPIFLAVQYCHEVRLRWLFSVDCIPYEGEIPVRLTATQTVRRLRTGSILKTYARSSY